jgi:hypothetical protein
LFSSARLLALWISVRRIWISSVNPDPLRLDALSSLNAARLVEARRTFGRSAFICPSFHREHMFYFNIDLNPFTPQYNLSKHAIKRNVWIVLQNCHPAMTVFPTFLKSN